MVFHLSFKFLQLFLLLMDSALKNHFQGLYRRAIELLKAPPLETEGTVTRMLFFFPAFLDH